MINYMTKEVFYFIDKRLEQIEKDIVEISTPELFDLVMMECLKARSLELQSLRLQIQLLSNYD